MPWRPADGAREWGPACRDVRQGWVPHSLSLEDRSVTMAKCNALLNALSMRHANRPVPLFNNSSPRPTDSRILVGGTGFETRSPTRCEALNAKNAPRTDHIRFQLYCGLQSMAGGPRATLRNTKRGEGTGEHASRPAHALHARLLLCTAWPVPRHPMLTFVLCVAQCCLHERSDSYEMCAVAARMCRA